MSEKKLPQFAVAVTLLVLGGCGPTEKGYSPTSGKVLVGGQPAEGLLVTLIPAGEPEKSDKPKATPAGLVGADGTFSLATFEPATRTTREGAPPGHYVMLLTWYPQVGLGSADHSPQPDRLGGRYKDPRMSKIRVEVKDGPTELPPIKLSEADVKGRKS